MPPLLTLPLKYLKGVLGVFGGVLRTSPYKWLAVAASFVLAVDGFQILTEQVVSTYNDAIAPAPSPPSLGVVLTTHIDNARDQVGSWFGQQEEDSTTFGTYIRPILALFAAFATAVATTESVREVLRPEEVALDKRMAAAAVAARERATAALESFYQRRLQRAGVL